MSPLREVATFCRVCEPACGLVAEVEGGEIRSLRPDREHPVTRGFACHKGLATLDIHRDPDRVDFPLRRVAPGRFERASWDEAIADIARRLREIVARDGGNAVSAYIGNPTAFNALAGPAADAFLAQLGAKQRFGSGTQDCANKFAGSEAVFGTSTLHPIPDLEHTDYLLVFGENPRVSHMSFLAIADPMQVLKRARKRGATIRFVNPRRIESAGPDTGDVVLIRPDTDLYLLAGMLCEIERSVGFREDVLAAHGKHADGLRAFVRRYPPERVARITGVDADEIRRLAREFAAAPSASVHMSTGVNMGRQGTLAYWLVHMLALVTGNLSAGAAGTSTPSASTRTRRPAAGASRRASPTRASGGCDAVRSRETCSRRRSPTPRSRFARSSCWPGTRSSRSAAKRSSATRSRSSTSWCVSTSTATRRPSSPTGCSPAPTCSSAPT